MDIKIITAKEMRDRNIMNEIHLKNIHNINEELRNWKTSDRVLRKELDKGYTFSRPSLFSSLRKPSCPYSIELYNVFKEAGYDVSFKEEEEKYAGYAVYIILKW